MMKKINGKITFGVLIILMVLLTSCTGRETDTTQQDWRKGTQAIEMNFIQGAPPSVVYNDDPIEFSVEVWNRGASPLYGYLYFTGFDDDIFSGMSKRPIKMDISDHKTKYNPEGGHDIISQFGRVILPEGVDVFKETRVVAEACYSYETISDVAVCIDPEPNKRDFSSDACRPKDVSGGSQAAPVAITNVQVEPTPQKTIFRITIKNVGKGTILDRTVVQDCLDSDVTFPLTDWVDVDEVKLGLNDHLRCETPNPVKLVNGVGKIHCIADNIRGSSAYATTLTIRLTYGYRESIEVPIEVRSTI